MRIEPAALDLPHQAGLHLVLREHLREATRHLGRLERAEDPEALHDFRVSLRRLRTLVRAFRPFVGGALKKRHGRRLGRFADATGAARDAEVQLGWLAGERPSLGPADRPALDWLAARLDGDGGGGHGALAEARLGGFRRLARRLEHGLEALQGPPAAGGPTLGEVLRERLAAQAAELDAALGEVAGPFDVERAHAARIAAKRLRYLLEPLRGCPAADAAPAIASLKALQDLLGELHDAHVLGARLEEALAECAVERSRRAHAAIQAGRTDAGLLRLASRDALTRGLLVLDARAAARAVELHARLERSWLPTERAALARSVAALCAALAGRAAAHPLPQRVFLLLRLPPEVAAEPAVLVRGSEPPGAPLERLRRTVVRGRRRFTFDDFGAGGPVLAATGAAPREAVRLPRWLDEVLVREVTDEKAYQEAQIAARRSRPPRWAGRPGPVAPGETVASAGEAAADEAGPSDPPEAGRAPGGADPLDPPAPGDAPATGAQHLRPGEVAG